MNNENKLGLSDHPIIVFFGLVTSLIAVFVFVTGKNTLPEWFNDEDANSTKIANVSQSDSLAEDGRLMDVPLLTPLNTPIIGIPDLGANQVVYASNDNGLWEIYVLGINNGQEQLLVSNAYDNSAPVWSPTERK